MDTVPDQNSDNVPFAVQTVIAGKIIRKLDPAIRRNYATIMPAIIRHYRSHPTRELYNDAMQLLQVRIGRINAVYSEFHPDENGTNDFRVWQLFCISCG